MSRAALAQRVLQVHAFYAERGIGLASAALAGAKGFVRWHHYPHKDVTDALHHTRFFYHAHDQDDASVNEHGHFHVFARHPCAAPEEYAHLVGISLNAKGEPTRLFTTNQWVTGENLQEATELEPLVRGFVVQTQGRLAPVAAWLTAMLGFYKDTVLALLHQRDTQLAKHRQGWQAALHDHKIHIVSQKRLTHHWDHLKKEMQ
ncbi:MAG: hypothetical protein RLZZ498_1635 [Pseudomonadota bacterium]|jgi:hypothetical protein